MIYRTIQNDVFKTISNPTILQQFNNQKKTKKKKLIEIQRMRQASSLYMKISIFINGKTFQ